MNLAPKASRGYAMAALLVALSVMAVVLSVALPAWSHMIRREKEEELIFRGKQYARAINQYQRKFANASPASLDLLIEQRMLRKKFKDPLSPNKDGEFQLLYVNQGSSPGPAGAGSPLGRGTAGAGNPGGRGTQLGGDTAAPLGTKPSGGIAGVASKNTGTSLRTYNQKIHYNEWQFVGMEQSMQAGPGAAGGRGGVGGRGGTDGRGGGPGRGFGTGGGFPGGGGAGSRGPEGRGSGGLPPDRNPQRGFGGSGLP